VTSLLLDTHCFVWLLLGCDELNPKILASIETAAREHHLTLSAVSVWEIGMLVSKQRLKVPRPIRQWMDEALATPGLALAPLTADIAIEATLLPGEFHGDGADRFLAATARVNGATIVTRDRRLLDYSKQGHIRAVAA